ncbi:lasso peptide biosynthesis B2 protein [Phenylobacterium sp. 58.2.17]|uniref:lasso peptide biosynthesis B2 protein n=1 Tax=Phenylobacterium sp. 58.2.17 TaxID=2969306 RepID=UPI002263BB70|nr:lasso peptide biosynthesis B2 protein [Phenylobacterium sp. 58.2.17]MCX7587287.1 lasso peptide biosynthesis B2 protein [Phenylobacterium sp. 58.2.17]
MSYHLASGTHAVLVGQDLVVLDIAGDAYFCHVGCAAQIDLAQRPSVQIASADLAKALIDAGLVTSAPVCGRRPFRRPPNRPSTDLWEIPPPSPMPGDRRRMCRAYADLLHRYAGRSLRQLVTTAQRRDDDGTALRSQEPSPELVRLSARFRQLLPWAPIQGECLFRSFMLLLFLRRSGLDALWVFGVRTWPFEAHCWLQVGDVVLNDSAEHVLGYEPIFAA